MLTVYLQRISEVDVLTAAAMESREVLLVYASEKALNRPFEETPQALAVSAPVQLRAHRPLPY